MYSIHGPLKSTVGYSMRRFQTGCNSRCMHKWRNRCTNIRHSLLPYLARGGPEQPVLYRGMLALLK